MTLRIRRGTDTERLAVTPELGEPVWTTDTNALFIGDGTTVGGVAAVANSNPGTITQTRELGFITVGAATDYMSSAFNMIGGTTSANIASVSPHHLLVNDGLLLVETLDYTISMDRTQVILPEPVRAALNGTDLQLINFVTALA